MNLKTRLSRVCLMFITGILMQLKLLVIFVIRNERSVAIARRLVVEDNLQKYYII